MRTGSADQATGEMAIGDGRRTVAGRSIRWDEARAAEAYTRGLWTRETLGDTLARAAEETPERTVLVDGDTRVDCAALHRSARRLAGAMLARMAPGEVVSFMLPNWHEAASIYLAATLAGMVVHPILPSLRARDLRFMLPDVGSRMVFVPAELRGHDYRAMLAEVCEGLAEPPETVVLRGAPLAGQATYADLLTAPELPLPTVDPDAVRMILYTSGTTGAPKGVMHTQNTLHALLRQLEEHWRIAPGDRFLVPSPIGHIGGSIYAFEAPLLLGTSAVLMERWDAGDAVALAAREPFTHLAGATPFLEQLLAAAKAAGERLPALKVFICGGASVPPSLIEEAAAWFTSASVTRVYGSTEVPVTTVGTLDRADVAHAAHTDGRPGLATIRLAPHSAATGPWEGEVFARGPQMLVGYVHAEDEAGLFDADGFYRTGDLGRLVDDGYLLISGRAKDIIIRHGENIAPKEVEDALREHPAVSEVAVVGLPDPRTGERACAVIVSAADAPAPSRDEVAAFLRGAGLAAFKLPEQVEHWPSLPKNPAGKVLKHEIRAALTASAPAASAPTATART